MRKPRFKADEKLEAKEMPLRSNGEARTEWIIPEPTFKAQDHDWIQQGVELICQSCDIKHGTFIPQGKTLTGKKGAWQLIETPVFRG